MLSKYPGTCRACGRAFPEGEVITWSRATGARHATDAACAAALAEPLPPAPAPIKADGIVALLSAARERGLKYPKVRFLAPGGGVLRLSLAGARARVPGSVQVLHDSEWLGRVEPDGKVVGRLLAADADVLATLATIATDPAKAAREYGALVGACSFCGLALTDAGSVEVGYGPVCAKKYGLPHKPKGAPVLTAEVAA